MTVGESKTLSAWQERVLRMEERIKGQVLADLQRKGVDIRRQKDWAPPPRVVKNPEIAQRLRTIEDYAEQSRKAIVNDDLSVAAHLMYEIALLADYRMEPAPRTNRAEGTADDRSIARRGGGVD